MGIFFRFSGQFPRLAWSRGEPARRLHIVVVQQHARFSEVVEVGRADLVLIAEAHVVKAEIINNHLSGKEIKSKAEETLQLTSITCLGRAPGAAAPAATKAISARSAAAMLRKKMKFFGPFSNFFSPLMWITTLCASCIY